MYPYWDFLIDSRLGENWAQSILYSEDWFGPANNTADTDYRPTGRFKNVAIPYDPAETEYPLSIHGPYGFLGNGLDFNPSKYLQRTNNFCGLQVIGCCPCARARASG